MMLLKNILSRKIKKLFFKCSSLHFKCSDIQDLALGVLKKLIPLSFSDVLLNEWNQSLIKLFLHIRGFPMSYEIIKL